MPPVFLTGRSSMFRNARRMTAEDVVRRIAAECGFVDDGAESSPSARRRRFARAGSDPVNPTGDSLLA